MARDIFNREVDLGTPIAADAIRMLIPDIGNEDMLIQRAQIQYNQNISRFWEVGSPKVYFYAGRTLGSAQFDRIIAGKGISNGFVARFGDVCQIAGNHMTLQIMTGCTSPAAMGAIQLTGCVINTLAYSIQAEDMVIHEAIGMMFAMLKI